MKKWAVIKNITISLNVWNFVFIMCLQFLHFWHRLGWFLFLIICYPTGTPCIGYIIIYFTTKQYFFNLSCNLFSSDAAATNGRSTGRSDTSGSPPALRTSAHAVQPVQRPSAILSQLWSFLPTSKLIHNN